MILFLRDKAVFTLLFCLSLRIVFFSDYLPAQVKGEITAC